MATKIGNFNLTIPAWELTDLDSLSSQGDLSGVNPDILAVMDQSESSGEGGYTSGGGKPGVPGTGDGGWYGLQSAATYTAPNGTAFKTTPTLLSETSPAAFDQQSEVAAAEIAHLIDEYGGNVAEAEQKYQGGSSEGANNLAAAGLAGSISPSSLASDQASGTAAGLASGNDNAGVGGATLAATDTGASGVFQELNDLLNPSGGNLLTQITSLGTSDLAAIVETVFFRGIFAVGFLLVTYAGIKSLSGGSGGGGSTVVQLYNQEANRSIKRGDQDIATQRIGQAQQRIDVTKQREDRLSKRGAPDTTAASAGVIEDAAALA